MGPVAGSSLHNPGASKEAARIAKIAKMEVNVCRFRTETGSKNIARIARIDFPNPIILDWLKGAFAKGCFLAFDVCRREAPFVLSRF